MIYAAVVSVSVFLYLGIRVAYWFLFERGADYTADGYVSLLAARTYRRNGHRRIMDIPNMVRPFPFVYPSLGIYIMSFFPEKQVLRFAGLMNTFFDLLYLLAVLLLCVTLHPGTVSVALAACAFIFLPALYGRNPTNAMHFSITWRDFGRLGASCFFLGVFLFEYTGYQGRYAPYIAGGTLVSFLVSFYGSQFAMQSIIFGSVFFSIISLTWFAVAAMLAGHLLVLLTDSKYLLRYYGFKYRHFKTYFKTLRHTHDAVTGDYAFSFRHLRTVLSHLVHFQFKYARVVASRDPFLRGVYLFPMQFPFVAAMLLMQDPVSKLLLCWYLAATAIWLLTLTPVLKVFGEPDRYLEFFGYFPVLIGLAYSNEFLFQEYLPVWVAMIAALLYQILFFRTEAARIGKEKDERRKKKMTDIGSVQRECRETGAFLEGENVLPLHFSHSWKIAYYFDCKVLYPPLDDEAETRFISNYPFPNWDNFDAIIEKYAIGYVVSDSPADFEGKDKLLKSHVHDETRIADYYIYRLKKNERDERTA